MKTLKACEIGLLLCCCVAITGCKTTVAQSSRIPTLQIGSPLKGVPPRTFVFREFKDTRGVAPRLYFDQAGSKMLMDMPIATVVSTAVRKELERNGHICLSEGTQQSGDYIVEGTVYNYWLNVQLGSLTTTHTANVGVKLTITGLGSHQGSLTKNYEGTAFLSYHSWSLSGGGKEAYEPLMNQALLNMVKELSTDQQFIDTIQK